MEVEQTVRLGSGEQLGGNVSIDPCLSPVHTGGTIEVSNQFTSLADPEVVLKIQNQLLCEVEIITSYVE